MPENFEANLESTENAKLSEQDKKDINTINSFLVRHDAKDGNETRRMIAWQKNETGRAYKRLITNEDPKTKSFKKFRNIIKLKVLTEEENTSQVNLKNEKYKKDRAEAYKENIEDLESQIGSVDISWTERGFINAINFDLKHDRWETPIVKLYNLAKETLVNKEAKETWVYLKPSTHQIYEKLSSMKKISILSSKNDSNSWTRWLDKEINQSELSLNDLNNLKRLNIEDNKVYSDKLKNSIKDLTLPLGYKTDTTLTLYNQKSHRNSFHQFYRTMRDFKNNHSAESGAEETFIKSGRNMFSARVDNPKVMKELIKRAETKYPNSKISVEKNLILVRYDMESLDDLKQSI